jgi:molybdopterin-synthase adenylyltransferase
MTDSRYSRQIRYREIGVDGQRRLGEARIAIVGIGALGTIETILARAGVGTLRLIDRDFVEPSNLQRQVLFTESDAAGGLPKAEAARSHLLSANSTIVIEARVKELTAATVDELLSDVDLVVDGADNFDVRYVVNDYCVRERKPWIYAAAVGTTGLLMPILPQESPCLRCLFEEPPPAGSAETCDTSGVLGSTTATIGALAALEALKIAAGRTDAVRRGLLQAELWENDLRAVGIATPRADCPCCAKREFRFLAPASGQLATSLCGRDAVQVTPSIRTGFEFDSVRSRLSAAYTLEDNGYLVRFQCEGVRVTLFRDGRAILSGTSDANLARAIYTRSIGT